LIASELAGYTDYVSSTEFGLRYGHNLQRIEGTKLVLSGEQFTEVQRMSQSHSAFLLANFNLKFESIDKPRAATSTRMMSASTVKSIAAVIHQLTKTSVPSYFALQEAENAYQFYSAHCFKLKSTKLSNSVITEVGGGLLHCVLSLV